MMKILDTIVRALGGASMLKYVFRRLLAAIPVLLIIIFFTFTLMRALPAGPFDFAGTKNMPEAVKAALSARFGLDKPVLLNLPSDGVSPDLNMETRTEFAAGPLCSEIRAGEAKSHPNVDVYQGWSLVRLATEYVEKTIDYKGKATRCLETRQVLYSDLTRSQFFNYVNNVLRLDFSLSMGRNSRFTPVSEIIGDRLPVSAQLGILAVLLGFVIGIPMGVVAALNRNSIIDYIVTLLTTTLTSVPNLVLGPLLIIIFVVNLKWLPEPNPIYWKNGSIFDWSYLGRAILPILALGLGMSAGIARLTRASLLQVLRDDYIRTARAKGLRERTVIYLHALKNSMIPVATIIGPLLAGILTGTLVTERIFAIPGLGSTFVDSIANRDYNLISGVVILFSVFLILGNIMVDIMYTWLDPRIRFD